MNAQEVSEFLLFLENELKLLVVDMHGKIFEHKIDYEDQGITSITFPHFVGEKNNVPLEIDFTVENEDYLSPNVKIYLKLTSTPFILSLKQEKQSILSAISKKLGLMQDIEVGNSHLDDRLIIQSDSPNLVKEFLSKPTVENILIKMDGFINIEFSDNSIEFLDAPFEEKKYSDDYFKSITENLVILASEYVIPHEIH